MILLAIAVGMVVPFAVAAFSVTMAGPAGAVKSLPLFIVALVATMFSVPWVGALILFSSRRRWRNAWRDADSSQRRLFSLRLTLDFMVAVITWTVFVLLLRH